MNIVMMSLERCGAKNRNEQEMDIMFQTNVLGMIHLVSIFLTFIPDGVR
jgi:hypothetical protein